jgi:hypothetical protein
MDWKEIRVWHCHCSLGSALSVMSINWSECRNWVNRYFSITIWCQVIDKGHSVSKSGVLPASPPGLLDFKLLEGLAHDAT